MGPRRRAYTRTGYLMLAKAAWGLEIDPRAAGAAAYEEPEGGGVAVVTIRGPLLQHRDPIADWLPECAFDSYDEIFTRAQAAFESELPVVMLSIDSPGGDAAGCMELGKELRAMSERTGKPLITWVDGMMASAALALGVAATGGIFAPPTASVGSIGCYEAILDVTAQDAAHGVKVRFVASGKRKLDGNPHVPLTGEALDALDERVNILAGLFFEHVSALRGVSVDELEALDGAVFIGPQALRIGLVDGLETSKALLERLRNPNEVRAMAGAAGSAKAAAKYKDMLAGLAEIAAGEDGPEKDAAKKMLGTLAGDDGGAPHAEPDEDDKAKKAKAEEDEKKKEAEAKAKAESDEKKEAEAKALAKSGEAMARELQEQKAKTAAIEQQLAQAKAEAARKEDEAAREKLLGTRPDFSPEQRATLALLPIDAVKKAVETWPRVAASAYSSASATTAGGGTSGGERRPGYQPQLSAEEVEMLRRSEPGRQSGGQASASQKGTHFQMPARILTKEEAEARLKVLEAEPV